MPYTVLALSPVAEVHEGYVVSSVFVSSIPGNPSPDGASGAEPTGPHRGVVIGVAAFWGLLCISLLLLGVWTFFYLRRPSRAEQSRVDPERGLPHGTLKLPAERPCVVVGPGEELCVGWRLPGTPGNVSSGRGSLDGLETAIPKSALPGDVY
jgi:hypothetical protein